MVDLLTRSDLASLAEPEAGATHVSLFLPTHRFGSEDVRADQLRWKNLVADVETRLLAEARRPDVEHLLAPARALQEEAVEWQHMSDGLVMLLRPGWHRTFRIPAPTSELATIGDRHLLGPLLRLLSGDGHFLLLAVSQRRIRLLEGSRNTVEEVELADVPTDLRDVVEPAESRSETMARPASAAAGLGGRAVFYGHGAGEEHADPDEVGRFLRRVSSGLDELLAAQASPLVLVGLERLVAEFREVSSYPHLVDDAVHHQPDDLSAEELHRMAWPLVEARLRVERSRAADRFHALNGTGRASSDLAEVAEAAAHGRVETLFVRADPWCWERVEAASPPVFRLGADEDFAVCERVDTAAVATLHAGGEVHATSETVVPGSEVAAIFRY